jgi:tRNA dimethylallyltransferase
VNLDEEFTSPTSLATVDELAQQSERIVVVGGTPFYSARTVAPARAPSGRRQGAPRGARALADPHNALREVDPVLAERLHPNDRVRIVRALEVERLTGRPAQ